MEANNIGSSLGGTVPCVEKGLVLLFRNPKEGGYDPFEEVLCDHGFTVGSVGVLEFSFTNISLFADHLTTVQFSVIIFTSKRAVEAAVHAMNLIKDEADLIRCKNLPCYVVGAGTFHDAESAGFVPMNQDAGNAEALAKKIINDMTTDGKAILYPCGNLRRDTLSKTLTKAGFSLIEVEVYNTQKSRQIKDHYCDFVQAKGLPEFVVYFSPSGVQSTEELFTANMLPVEQVKIVAIGPTTESELHRKCISVSSVADSPDPEGLARALLRN